MALISCYECDNQISTEAVACPHCGAPQQRTVPPPLPIQRKEETIYSDRAVSVTTARVVICGTTYALRNVTSVRMAFTPPTLVKVMLLLIIGLMILLAAFMPLNEKAPAPVGVYIIAGAMIGGAILWMINARTMYHVKLSTAAGEVHALTSKDKVYIARVVLIINEAIAKYQ